jgi:hypothetical protein
MFADSLRKIDETPQHVRSRVELDERCTRWRYAPCALAVLGVDKIADEDENDRYKTSHPREYILAWGHHRVDIPESDTGNC